MHRPLVEFVLGIPLGELCRPGQSPFLFFLSSRRRHTRSLRDWSSDVCSSDLLLSTGDTESIIVAIEEFLTGGRRRSEERRVGKECRSRWSAYHYKKKIRCSAGGCECGGYETQRVGHVTRAFLR